MGIQLSNLTCTSNHFKFPPIKSNGRIALQNFHQKLKVTITWLNSIDYEIPIKSNENLAKVLLCLPCNMQNEFYKVTCNPDILDGDVDLIFLEKWLEKCLKIFFNLIANIIATQGTKTDNQHQKKKKKIKKGNRLTYFTILHYNHLIKLKKTTKTRICYLCSQDHGIMVCVKFKQENATKTVLIVYLKPTC